MSAGPTHEYNRNNYTDQLWFSTVECQEIPMSNLTKPNLIKQTTGAGGHGMACIYM